MAAVCALAFAVGSVIRFNIKHAEPVLAGTPGEATLSLERSSDLALVLAYVISVCLYIHILAAFVLGGFHADNELNENLITTAIIAIITLIGVTKGLVVLDVLEQWGLYVTLLIIVLLRHSALRITTGMAWQLGVRASRSGEGPGSHAVGSPDDRRGDVDRRAGL